MNAYCREQGVYSHQVMQWKKDFTQSHSAPGKANTKAENKALKAQNKVFIELINEAHTSGACQLHACKVIGLTQRTLQRWKHPDKAADGRIDAPHAPANKLTPMERQADHLENAGKIIGNLKFWAEKGVTKNSIKFWL